MRRTPAALTRDKALDVSDLLIKSGVSPNTLASLLNQPASVMSGWFTRNVRPTQKVMREAVSTLKRIIELRKSNPRLSLTNTQSLKAALAEEPQADVVAFKSAYFTEGKDRTKGTVLVTLNNGKVMEFENTLRSEFYDWSQHNFEAAYAPSNIFWPGE